MKPIFPVIFGFDIADYAFARIFHESLGVRSLVVTEIARGPINDSSIFDVEFVPKSTLGNEESFIALLHEISKAHQNEQLILCVNTDEGVEFAAKHAAELTDWFLPYSSVEVVRRANSKGAMAQILTELGLPVVKNVVVDLSKNDWATRIASLQFPVVVKPENGAELDVLAKKGLKKAKPIDTPEAAIAYFSALTQNGVAISLMVQELVMGDDTTQWVINGYVDAHGVVTAAGCGRVLLGLHEPMLIGNAALIMLDHNVELIEEGKRIVQAAGIHGFFSLDVKIDPRNGQKYWLDLNPRIGRGHYYLKVGGIDLVRAMMADLAGQSASYQTNSLPGLYAVVPSCLANSRYIHDRELLEQVRKAKRRTINPLRYPADRSLKRWWYRTVNNANQWRKMRRIYPNPTETGF